MFQVTGKALLLCALRCKSRWWACWSGQISIIPEPEVSGFWGGNFFPYCSPPLKVTSAKVIIICPGWYEGGVVVQPPTDNCMSLDTNSKTDHLPQLRYNSFRGQGLSAIQPTLVMFLAQTLGILEIQMVWRSRALSTWSPGCLALCRGWHPTQLHGHFNKPWHKDPY